MRKAVLTSSEPSGGAVYGYAERTAWIGAVGVLTLVTAGALMRELRPTADPAETRLEIRTPATTDPASMAIAPDGQKIVFSAPSADGQPQLWIRFLDDESARPVASTEGATVSVLVARRSVNRILC